MKTGNFLEVFEKSQFFLKHISIRIWRRFSRDQLHEKKGIKESESDAPLETVNLAHFLTCHKLLIDKLYPFKNWKARKETKIKVAPPFISIQTVFRFASAVNKSSLRKSGSITIARVTVKQESKSRSKHNWRGGWYYFQIVPDLWPRTNVAYYEAFLHT